jgi:AcrR family transcriptional regulator
MNRQEERSRATQDCILDAAISVFASNGYSGSSIDDISHVSGMTKGAIYHHFPDKASVFMAVANAAMTLFDEEVMGAMAGGTDALVRIRRLLGATTQFVSDHPDISRLYVRMVWDIDSVDDGELKALILDSFEKYRGETAQVILDGISDGCIREVDAVEAASLIMAIKDGLLLHLTLGLQVPRNDQMVDLLLLGLKVVK